MEKASVYDFARLCDRNNGNCNLCLLNSSQNGTGFSCSAFVKYRTDKANKIILNWCKEHPAQTRQDRFLKMFPNVKRDEHGTVKLCPKKINTEFECRRIKTCEDCREEYWLAEVGE